MNSQIDIVKAEFAKQAATFGRYQQHSEKIVESQRTIDHLGLTGQERILEVAAGTCAFGRLAAPHVAEVVELDATEAMLDAGRAENEVLGLRNVSYMTGVAEQLPFPDATFDVVLCRLAFHHFADGGTVMREMSRVLKPGGQVAIIDVIPNEDSLRHTADHLERLRDPSHVSFPTVAELHDWLAACGLRATWQHTAAIPISLLSWLKLTDTPTLAQQQILSAIHTELQGGAPTGLAPTTHNDTPCITHLWHSLTARKEHSI